MLHQLMILLASNMPEDEILNDLEEDIHAYRGSKDADDKTKLLMSCTLLITKHQTDNEGAEKLMETIANHEKVANLVNKTEDN